MASQVLWARITSRFRVTKAKYIDHMRPTGCLGSVEKLVCKIYEKLTEITNIDQMRIFLFNEVKDADSLPPTSIGGTEAPHKSSPLSDNCMAKCHSSVSGTHGFRNWWTGV